VPDPDNPNQSTLPRPELNPLLNPVLAAHMGRWAEVYFTNPPEKREQAVVELLRELESAEDAAHREGAPVGTEMRAEEGGTAFLRAGGSSVVCATCGHENRNQNLFCGSCGARLPVEAARRETFLPVESAPRAFAGSPDAISPTLQQIIEDSAEEYSASADLPPLMPPDAAHEPAWLNSSRSDETTEPQQHPIRVRDSALTSAADEPASQPRSPSVPPVAPGDPVRRDPALRDPVRRDPVRRDPVRPAPSLGISSARARSQPTVSRWRLYAWGAVAIFLIVLLYSGWRAQRGSSIPATLSPPSSQPAAASPAPAHAGKRPAHAVKERVTPAPKPAPAAPPVVSDSVPPPAVAPAPVENGGEELAMAQKYLKGAHGAAPDSSEAAQWLWKAVAKKNMTATLLLSDLYLRGDGVARSCDQARLLLEAAAQKGMAVAETRLRNLQDSGCQ